MIETRIVAKENKKSAGIYGAYTKGEFCIITDAWEAEQVTALTYGQAEAGMIRLVRSTGGTANNIRGKVYPIDKFIFINAESETDYDVLTSGDLAIYYDRGRFATNIYDPSITTGTTVGTSLYVNTTGWLSVSSLQQSGNAIAVLVGHEVVGTTNYFNGTALYNKNMIVYDLL